MNKSKVLLFIFIAFAVLFWSCQQSELPVENSNSTQLNKIFSSAVLKINILDIAGNTDSYPYYDLRIQKISTPWEEMTATWLSPWTNGGGDFDNASEVSYKIKSDTISYPEVIELDISALWSNGTPPYGIILRIDNPAGEDKRIKFSSREGNVPPEVIVSYSDAPDKTIKVIEDTWISNRTGYWNGDPNNDWSDDNFGFQPYLYAGNISPTAEKRTILKFQSNPVGCTLTQGYWKTHAKIGSKKYDETWNQIGGPNADFFNSGKSYIKVLWTAPKKGNAYYILAHQYIAAKLNQLNGASIPTEVKNAFDRATELFDASSSDTIGNTNRKEWIKLSEILDDYNNGLSGPGHCE